MFSLLAALLVTVAVGSGDTPSLAVPPTEMEIAGPRGPLKATVVEPEGRQPPTVLIIPGSGPTDRDGNSANGAKPGTYRLLADELARQGVASIRIDKRGMFGSAAAIADANDVTMVEYARDALAWVAAAKERTGAPCVWILGHSEGGLVALLAAQRGKDICGLVLAATPGRPVADVLKQQLRAIPVDPALIDEAVAVVDALNTGRRFDPAALSPAVLAVFRPELYRFLGSILALDPAALTATVQQPVLILQGDRDIQVGVADAQLLKAAKPDAELALIPSANHVLKPVNGTDRAANLAASINPDLALAPGVADAVARFVTAPR